MLKSILRFLIFRQVFKFAGVGIVLWTTILLQLVEHDIPCEQCWEIRGAYLLILQLLLFGLLFGSREFISIIILMLFMFVSSFLTIHYGLITARAKHNLC